MDSDQPRCTLILPCRDEAAALSMVLAGVPAAFEVLVVDNGSTDDTAAVAIGAGARVVYEPRPGYGAAVHAGVLAADTDYVAVMDGDGSFDAADLPPLLAEVAGGLATMAVGRRVPTRPGIWPWHARWGNQLVMAYLRRRTPFRLHDIAAVRVCARADLLALEIEDRRFGYPLELLRKAFTAGWRITEHKVDYHPRAVGTRSKVSGSLIGSIRAARDFAKALR